MVKWASRTIGRPDDQKACPLRDGAFCGDMNRNPAVLLQVDKANAELATLAGTGPLPTECLTLLPECITECLTTPLPECLTTPLSECLTPLPECLTTPLSECLAPLPERGEHGVKDSAACVQAPVRGL